ncbi:MAG TPA: glycosyl hydrolase [Solirubrobacterales bacterium]|nr:glycosyl hydrolase [Solirubrobacterales bacterium]
MRFPPNTFRLLLVALVAGCVLAPGAGAAEGRADVGASLAVAAPGSGAKACTKRTSRTSRALASRGRSAPARRARRAEAKQRRRCLNRLRRAKRKRATASSLPTQVSGGLLTAIDGGHGGWSDSEIEHREELGAAVTRHEWDPYEPVDEQEDVVETAAGEIGTRLHALLGGNDLGDAGHYREFVVDFIRRYGQGGSFWDEHPELDEARFAITTVELGNEPYFGEMSPEDYAATVRPTLEEIQRLGLPVTVVLPSRVYGSDTDWIDTLYRQIPNLNEYFDAFADHPYWYGHNPAEVAAAGPFGRIETLRKRMNELGANTKAIYLTEYGESTAACGEECTDEAGQAQHLKQMLDAITTRPDWGVKMFSVFQLIDRGTNTSDRELGFGLLRQNGTEKPAYPIVQSALEQYRG